MTGRDDFYKLDEYSFGKCLKILEEYEAARLQVELLLEAVDPDFAVETFDALDECFSQFGSSGKVKLFRAILAQIKKEKFPVEDDNA